MSALPAAGPEGQAPPPTLNQSIILLFAPSDSSYALSSPHDRSLLPGRKGHAPHPIAVTPAPLGTEHDPPPHPPQAAGVPHLPHPEGPDLNPLAAMRDLLEINKPMLEKRDPLLLQYISCIRTARMQPEWEHLIPDPLRESWSTLAVVTTMHEGKTISLTSMRRQVQKLALGYVIAKKHKTLHAPHPLTAPWWDPEGMVNGMITARQLAHDGPEYDRAIPGGPDYQPSTTFVLPEWVREHQRTCQSCEQQPSFAALCAVNQTNPCYFSHILAWLYGKWRFPLTARPPPGHLDNYASFSWSPISMAVEVQRMLELGHLVEGQPELIHPSMGVVKSGDIKERLLALAAIGRPSQHTEPHQVDLLNQDLEEARASLPPHHPEQVRLKKVKTRYCLDQSRMLNSVTIPIPMECATVHDAVALLNSEWWMAKLDLERMFNQLGIHPEDQVLLGACFMVDGILKTFTSTRAQFGGALYPHYASTLMAEVARILRSYGIRVVFLMDDIFICAATEAECQHALRRALGILQRLGWAVQHDKLEGPAQLITFLGVVIDTVHRRLSISQERMELIALAILEVVSANDGHTLSFRTLSSLVGKLNWVAEVMLAGRPRVKRIRDCLHQGKWSWSRQQSRRYNPKITLSQEAVEDLQWWLTLCQTRAQPGRPSPWVPFWSTERMVTCRVFSDASGEGGFGVIFEDTIYHGSWAQWTQQHSSGFKELLPILFALDCLGPRLENHVVVFTTDNLGNAFALNKGSSRSTDSFRLIFRIFEVAAQYNIYLVADWIPREWNVFADYITKVFHPHLLY